MNTLMKVIKERLESLEIHFTEVNESLLTVDLGLRNGHVRTIIAVDDPRGLVTVVSVCPFTAADGTTEQVMELVTRINRAISTIGHFDLDVDSGSIRFRTSAMFGQAEPQQEAVTHLLFANWCLTNRHLPAIAAVLFTGTAPADALANLERDTQGSSSQPTPPGGRLRGLIDGTNN